MNKIGFSPASIDGKVEEGDILQNCKHYSEKRKNRNRGKEKKRNRGKRKMEIEKKWKRGREEKKKRGK